LESWPFPEDYAVRLTLLGVNASRSILLAVQLCLANHTAGYRKTYVNNTALLLMRSVAYVDTFCAQTETPEQLRQRNSARKPGQKVVSVVERQAVAVLSRGTLMDPEMVAGHPDAAYVLAGERSTCW
jgi:hypothetical protein